MFIGRHLTMTLTFSAIFKTLHFYSLWLSNDPIFIRKKLMFCTKDKIISPDDHNVFLHVANWKQWMNNFEFFPIRNDYKLCAFVRCIVLVYIIFFGESPDEWVSFIVIVYFTCWSFQLTTDNGNFVFSYLFRGIKASVLRRSTQCEGFKVILIGKVITCICIEWKSIDS